MLLQLTDAESDAASNTKEFANFVQTGHVQ